jgi:hypothetical protein
MAQDYTPIAPANSKGASKQICRRQNTIGQIGMIDLHIKSNYNFKTRTAQKETQKASSAFCVYPKVPCSTYCLV